MGQLNRSQVPTMTHRIHLDLLTRLTHDPPMITMDYYSMRYQPAAEASAAAASVEDEVLASLSGCFILTFSLDL